MSIETIIQLKEELKQLHNQYRSAPFWAWNDKLNRDELRIQMDGMKEQGVGGLFIHSREGLETPYLSEEWMACVDSVVRYGKEKELDVWIYDEDKWPSGMAGGMVSAYDHKYAAKAITMEVYQGKYTEEEQVLGIFQIAEDGIYCKCHSNDMGRDKNGKYVIFRMESAQSSSWYNQNAPSDNLNPDSVKKFLELTHEKYKKDLKENLQENIKGFFTDEPNVCDFFSVFTKGRPWLPWTSGFVEYFKDKRGYDLRDYLPCLFYPVKEAGKICHDYFKTIAERFCDSYFKQLKEWGEKEKVKMTGHLLFENDLGYNPRTSGSVMLHYKYMDIPGIDILGELTEEILTVKQCTSVANQYKKEHVMSEMYGCTKWELDFEGQKWLGDWQFVMGVNLRCQHLALYSLKGLRKRDFPPVFNYQTSWWKYNKIMEDYFARFAVCASYGEVVRDILVIHPQSTMWMLSSSSESENLSEMEDNMGWTDKRMQTLNALGNEFNLFIGGILGIHQDCDLGDELLMEMDGRVENGRIFAAQVSYGVVVIPKVLTLFSSTISLLEKFMDQGGTVIAVGKPPNRIDGMKSELGKQLYGHKNMITCDYYEDAIQRLNRLPHKISVINKKYVEEGCLYTMLRESEDGTLAILCNNDRINSHEVLVTLEGIGNVAEYDLLDASFHKIAAEADIEKNCTRFAVSCEAAGSKVFLLDKGQYMHSQAVQFEYRHVHAGRDILAVLKRTAVFERTEYNTLVLDRCCFWMEEGAWSEKKDVWQAQKELREILDMRQIYYNGVPQRYGWVYEKHKNDGKMVRLKFEFQVKDVPETDCYLAVEQSEYFEVKLNGELCDTYNGYFMDKCLDKIKLPALQKGRNELVLTCAYLNKMELEDIYILGDFGVDKERTITKEPERLFIGDWTLQGYPYYGGSIKYYFSIDIDLPEKKIILDLGHQNSTVTEVSVNGNKEIYPWNMKRDVTSFLKQGRNDICIQITGSPRNIFGPFHQAYDKNARISWADFRTEGKYYSEEYILKPYGLTNPVVLYSQQL